jgi:uncharacterized protein YecE (DUF72 family)
VRIRIGTSGWVYKDWRGDVYPEDVPQRRWLATLADRFPTLEVNASFYRLPDTGTFARWRDEVPGGFVFAVKASRYITHIRRLRDCEDAVALFWQRATALGPALGPVLFQLPPRFVADADLLAGFLGLLPAGLRAAFEFRDASWDADEVRSLLDDAGAAWVLADRPGRRVPLHVTGGWSYVRFHQGRREEAAYTRRKLRRWADAIVGLPADEVFGFFNNDQKGAAVRDADALTRLIARRGGRGIELARAG